MAVNIGPKIGIDGEKAYRDEINNIIQQGKTLAAEMDAVGKGFSEAGDNQTKFERESQTLNKQIENQRSLIEHLKDAVEKSAEKTGENSTATLKWKEQLNKAQGELATMEGKLDELTDGTEEFTEEEEKATEKTSIFGDVLKAELLSKAIIDGIKKLADSMKAVGDAMITGFTDTVKWADDLATLSTQTSISTETLQEWEYAANLVDVDVSTLTASNAKLLKSMDAAAGGSKAQVEAFDKLGVSYKNADGSLRDVNDVMFDAFDALGGVENAAERDALAMDLFGKSARDLNPLIETGSEAFAALAQEAHETGYVLDEEAIGSLLNVSDSMERIDKAGDTLQRNLSATFAPTVASALESVVPYVQTFGTAIADVFAGRSDVSDFVDLVVDKTEELLSDLESKAPVMLEQGEKLLKSLVSGIQRTVPRLVELVVPMIGKFTKEIASNLGTILDSGIKILLSIINGIISALPDLIGMLPDLIAQVAATLIENLPLIIETGIRLIFALVEGIGNALGNLDSAAETIFNAIGDVLSGFGKAALDWGDNLVKGLWQGISNSLTWIKNKIKGWVGNVTDFIKNLFGIHSPSTVFAGIGRNLALGLEGGFTDEMKDVARGMSAAIPVSFGTVGGGSSKTTNLGGISIVVNGAEGQNANEIADIVMQKMQTAVSRREAVFA